MSNISKSLLAGFISYSARLPYLLPQVPATMFAIKGARGMRLIPVQVFSITVILSLLGGCSTWSKVYSSASSAAPTPSTPPGPVVSTLAKNTGINDAATFSVPVTKDKNGNIISTGTMNLFAETMTITATDSGNPTSISLSGGVLTNVPAVTNKPGLTIPAVMDNFTGTATNGQTVTVYPKAQYVPATPGSPIIGLQYSNFGAWNMQGTAFGFTFGTFGSGTPTATASMPTSGSATYSGHAMGISVASNAIYNIHGNLTMTADFALNTISGSMTGMQAALPNSTSTAAGAFNDITLAPVAISGAAFTLGTATAGPQPAAGLNPAGIAAGSTGTYSGHFYGPAANEVTGVWSMNGGNVAGAFGAKQ